jgi:hypothetical protein
MCTTIVAHLNQGPDLPQSTHYNVLSLLPWLWIHGSKKTIGTWKVAVGPGNRRSIRSARKNPTPVGVGVGVGVRVGVGVGVRVGVGVGVRVGVGVGVSGIKLKDPVALNFKRLLQRVVSIRSYKFGVV